MKKRILAMVMVTMMAAMTVLTGCGNSSESSDDTVTIGISQFAEHGSLDNCREGFLLGLSEAGFVEGENAVQPAGVADGVWALFCFLPAAGFAIALVILGLFYKLRTKDVQVMSQYNNGKITREEAESKLAEKYGPAGAK